MKDSTKKIYISIASLLVIFPVLLMPFFVKKNMTDIQEMDKRYAVTLEDVIEAENKSTAFEDWFNDHLAFRKAVISSYAAINLSINVSTNNNMILIGKDRWLFLGDYYNDKISKYRRMYDYDASFADLAINNLKLLDEKLDKQGIDFVCVMAPDKSSIYPEYMPKWTTVDSKPKYLEMVESLGGVDSILDLTPALLAEKEKYQNDLYSKTDSHWTTLGAYFGYLECMNALNNDKEKPLKVVQLLGYKMVEKEEADDLAKTLGYAGNYLDYNTDVNMESNERISPVFLTDDTSWRGFCIYENSEALNPETILILGDSFSGRLIPCYYNTYSKVYFIHYTNILNTFVYDTESSSQALERVIAEANPDVVILEAVERGFDGVVISLPQAY